MRTRTVIGILVIVPLASACATKPDSAVTAVQNRPMTCTAGPDCDAKWSRAVQWVLLRAPIQIQTDEIIQTFRPEHLSFDSAFFLTKRPAGEGTFDIGFQSYCGNTLGCRPSEQELRASFANAVTGPPEPVPGIPWPPHLGVQFEEAPAAAPLPASARGAQGVIVLAVDPGSLAEGAGILPGDVIYFYDDRPIRSFNDFLTAVLRTPAGKAVRIKAFRRPAPMEFTVQF